MCELMAEPDVSSEPRPLRDASVDEEEVCFVCMEPCSEASRCACTYRNVHQECMLKWLRTNNTTECPVCKVEYPHVDIERKVYKCPATACLGMALGCITFVAFLVCGSLQLAMYLSPDFVSATLTLAVGMLMIAVATVGYAPFTRTSQNYTFPYISRTPRTPRTHTPTLSQTHWIQLDISRQTRIAAHFSNTGPVTFKLEGVDLFRGGCAQWRVD